MITLQEFYDFIARVTPPILLFFLIVNNSLNYYVVPEEYINYNTLLSCNISTSIVLAIYYLKATVAR